VKSRPHLGTFATYVRARHMGHELVLMGRIKNADGQTTAEIKAHVGGC